MAAEIVRRSLKATNFTFLKTLTASQTRIFSNLATSAQPESSDDPSSSSFTFYGGDPNSTTTHDNIIIKGPKETSPLSSQDSASVAMPMSFMTGSIVGKRFYKKVTTREADDGIGWSVMLDYRTLKTPSKRPLKCPTLALAKAIAAEWEHQEADGIRPFTMPLTKLSCTALERVPLTRQKIIDHLMKKFPQDLVFCRAPGDNDLTSGVCGFPSTKIGGGTPVSVSKHFFFQNVAKFCTLLGQERADDEVLDNVASDGDDACDNVPEDFNVKAAASHTDGRPQAKHPTEDLVDFTRIHINKLPTVVIIGRPNVGKSALFNRLIRRREALVYNTPTDHVTRDIREGVAKLGNLRFKVLDSAGLEAEASSGSVLRRTAEMTGNVLSRSQLALFLVDARDGLQPMDLDVGKWLRKNAPGMKTIVVMNKAESLDDYDGSLAAAVGESYTLGFGDPIALSAETGMGMAELHETLRPLLEEYVLQNVNDDESQENDSSEDMECKLPLQLAIVGRPNVGKSTLLNTILQEDRVLVGPEAGLTRDSIRAEFEYQGRTIYLVDTAGWLERTKQDKGPASLSIMQSRKHLMRAHIIALVLDAEEIAKARRSMKHAEVVIARRAVEEGRGLVVIVNKMDLLRGEENSKLYKRVIEAVPAEIQTVIPQVTGIPVVFVSALEGKGRMAVMRQVVETYEKWCLRLPTARLNRWLRKVMSRHSWKDQAAQPKIKYFTQVKARPPTFIAFMSGKTQLSVTDLRFLTRSLKEDFDLGGIPVRILQRTVERNGRTKTSSKNEQSTNRAVERVVSDKRTILAVENSSTT